MRYATQLRNDKYPNYTDKNYPKQDIIHHIQLNIGIFTISNVVNKNATLCI